MKDTEKETKVTKKSETSKDKSKKVEQKPYKLYSIDTFIKTVLQSPMFPEFDRVKAQGFKAHMLMKDKYYVDDESIFVEELKKYLK